MCRNAAAVMIAWCVLATAPSPGNAEEYLDLPTGVIHVALPPGPIEMKYTVKNDKPLLRLSSGKAVIVAQDYLPRRRQGSHGVCGHQGWDHVGQHRRDEGLRD